MNNDRDLNPAMETATPGSGDGEASATPDSTQIGANLEDLSARERIVEAAIRLFSEKGFENASVREIVEAAGVTKPVLYYYFKNKDDVLHKIVCDTLKEFSEGILAAVEGPFASLRDQLEAINETYMRPALEEPALVRFIHALFFSGRYQEIFDFDSQWRGDIERVANVFERAQARGEVRDDLPPDVLSSQFLGVAYHSMRSIIYCPDPERGPLVRSSAVDVFLRGAQPGRAAAPRSGGNGQTEEN